MGAPDFLPEESADPVEILDICATQVSKVSQSLETLRAAMHELGDMADKGEVAWNDILLGDVLQRRKDVVLSKMAKYTSV